MESGFHNIISMPTSFPLHRRFSPYVNLRNHYLQLHHLRLLKLRLDRKNEVDVWYGFPLPIT